MNDIHNFMAYAAKFEEVFLSDDWSQMEPLWHEDASYHMIGADPLEGREAVFAGLKNALDQSDRRFETRKLAVLEGPEMRDGAVWLRWRATYTLKGLPPLVMDGEETVLFRDNKIAKLVDEATSETLDAVEEWMNQYEDQLPPPKA